MRLLPARGRRVSRGGGVAGLPIRLEAMGAGGRPEGPMSVGRRGALGVANSRGDSRPGEGWVEKGMGGLVSSGWVSMASGSEEGSCRVVS